MTHFNLTKLAPFTTAFGLGLLLWTQTASALPPNPERPFDAKTCAQALERLAQAQIDSPLISAKQMEQLRLLAHAQALRLCGKSVLDRKGHNAPQTDQ